MIKEAKNVDFLTTGRQPSAHDFARISEWIRQDKKKNAAPKSGKSLVANAGPALKKAGKSKQKT
ncbi:MAG: hypothetical protein EOO14_01105 [Chitinophagaceae bacterium]|nr:MAG: hypothetical protein EOO14_01105 [Chitinophagaceae bacterium]